VNPWAILILAIGVFVIVMAWHGTQGKVKSAIVGH
jgi:hypothetical protein